MHVIVFGILDFDGALLVMTAEATMNLTIAFDVYGTLIDPFGVVSKLTALVGDRAPALAQVWRAKQIEYLFRRALGRVYEPFSVCTSQALDFACDDARIELSAPEKGSLLDVYRELPAYSGVADALREMKQRGCATFAFSNGEQADLEHLLAHANLKAMLSGVVSVDEVRSYKPDPAVYALFLERAGSLAADTWLVSANAFDVIGAQSCGWRTVWIRPTAAVFDPWGIEPTVTIDDIAELPGAVC